MNYTASQVWRENMREVMVPRLLSAWLRGDSVALKRLCKDDVMAKLSNDIATRKKEKVKRPLRCGGQREGKGRAHLARQKRSSKW